VLIGVNRYRMPGADLRGCVSDVQNMQRLLTQQFGFAAGDITALTDFDATKKAIETSVRKLIAGGRKGDVLLVHFSGHGSNVPDDDGDEADGRDEILCPADLDWKDPLRDDWLRTTFDGLKAGVSLTVVTDCCHSGTITRAVLPPDAPVLSRYLPNPLDLLAVESGRALRGKPRGGLRMSAPSTRKTRDIVAVDLPEVLITGCRADQTSADAAIAGGYHGALTYNLVASLVEAKGKLSYRELHERAADRLKRGRFDQVPQLEGAKARLDQPFLAPIE
ncbi:MAG: caspase family protein, partial [Burkholderiaceae bacterium]